MKLKMGLIGLFLLLVLMALSLVIFLIFVVRGGYLFHFSQVSPERTAREIIYVASRSSDGAHECAAGEFVMKSFVPRNGHVILLYASGDDVPIMADVVFEELRISMSFSFYANGDAEVTSEKPELTDRIIEVNASSGGRLGRDHFIDPQLVSACLEEILSYK